MPIQKAQLKQVLDSYNQNRGSAWMGGWDYLAPQSIKNAKILLAEVKEGSSLSAEQTARLVKCFVDHPTKPGQTSHTTAQETLRLLLNKDDISNCYKEQEKKDCLQLLPEFTLEFLPQLSKEGHLSANKIGDTVKTLRDVFLFFGKLHDKDEKLRHSEFKKHAHLFLTAKKPNLLAWFFMEMCEARVAVTDKRLKLFMASDFYRMVDDNPVFDAKYSFLDLTVTSVSFPMDIYRTNGYSRDNFHLAGAEYRRILQEAIAQLKVKDFDKNFWLFFPVNYSNGLTQEEIYTLHRQIKNNIAKFDSVNFALYENYLGSVTTTPDSFHKFNALCEHFQTHTSDWDINGCDRPALNYQKVLFDASDEALTIFFNIMQKTQAKSFLVTGEQWSKIFHAFAYARWSECSAEVNMFLDILPSTKEDGQIYAEYDIRENAQKYFDRWLGAWVGNGVFHVTHTPTAFQNRNVFWRSYWGIQDGNHQDALFHRLRFDPICQLTKENHKVMGAISFATFLSAIPSWAENLVNNRQFLLTENSERILWSRLPPHFRFTQQQWQDILRLCVGDEHQWTRTYNEALRNIENYVINNLLNPPDAKQQAAPAPNAINNAQSTHTASVHKTVSESAVRLMTRYGKQIEGSKLENIIKQLSKWIESLKGDSKNIDDKNLAAKRCVQRLLAPDYSFIDAGSRVSVRQLLGLLWLAIHDEASVQIDDEKYKGQKQTVQLRSTSKEDALNLLVEAFYEIQRGYNLSDKDVDDKKADHIICTGGTFNKFIEKLNGKHRDIQMKFITPRLAGLKLLKVVQEEVDNHFAEKKAEIKGDEKKQEAFNQQLKKVEDNGIEELWKFIVDKITKRMFDEFSILYKDAKDARFLELIDGGKWAPLDLKKWAVPAAAIPAATSISAASVPTSSAAPATTTKIPAAAISQAQTPAATAQPQPARAASVFDADAKDQKSDRKADQKTSAQPMSAQPARRGGAATASERAHALGITMFGAAVDRTYRTSMESFKDDADSEDYSPKN